jgi:dinuclear metal center YbgI/SA1388 family protein
MVLKVKDIINAIEEFAPGQLQESWDNSGLLVGRPDSEINSALISLDVNEAVIDDAIKHGNGLIIAHHPLIFSGIKRINGKNDAERTIIKAIQNNIAIYAAHTNIDVVRNGVSWQMAKKLGLVNIKTLIPQKGILKKLVTYIPVNDAHDVRDAIFNAGAGHIGNYESCSFNTEGTGSFRGNSETTPYKGAKGKLHFEKEVRLETIFPDYLQNNVVSALINAHPYEEVAYDIYQLDNHHNSIGLGVIGEMENETGTKNFLEYVKKTFNCKAIRHTNIHKEKIKKVALLGGAGSSFLKQAILAGADVFISGDFKYHQFFDAENKIVIADIGHYESEQFTKELFYEIVTNKFSKFALRLSDIDTNPINYLF